MAVYNPHEYKCQQCKVRYSTGCGACPFEENRRTIHKFVGIRKLQSLPQSSTLPPKTKKINGRRYTLAGRYETKGAAIERAKFLRQLHTNRIGYSLRVVALPKSQWGAVNWDIKPFALYVLYGRGKIARNKGIAQLFE